MIHAPYTLIALLPLLTATVPAIVVGMRQEPPPPTDGAADKRKDEQCFQI
jgi:hypothetical protein